MTAADMVCPQSMTAAEMFQSASAQRMRPAHSGSKLSLEFAENCAGAHGRRQQSVTAADMMCPQSVTAADVVCPPGPQGVTAADMALHRSSVRHAGGFCRPRQTREW